MKGTLFLAGYRLLFFGNVGSQVAWSRLGSNPGPSDSQSDAMTKKILLSASSFK